MFRNPHFSSIFSVIFYLFQVPTSRREFKPSAFYSYSSSDAASAPPSTRERASSLRACSYTSNATHPDAIATSALYTLVEHPSDCVFMKIPVWWRVIGGFSPIHCSRTVIQSWWFFPIFLLLDVITIGLEFAPCSLFGNDVIQSTSV